MERGLGSFGKDIFCWASGVFLGRRQERPGASKVAVLAQSLGADFDPTKMDVTDVEDLFGMIFLGIFWELAFFGW